ncbi:uncharacterized protein LOC135210464 [Macrobrachium nipponense]|uniref:uncharacterized protein LOC135210464 n=1 Tax=Macrobrachium nipponense TaxID=159736 RepID=UPI0030C7B10A
MVSAHVSPVNDRTPPSFVWRKISKIAGKFTPSPPPVLKVNGQIITNEAGVILCLLTGLGTTCAYVSSSWATGETEVKVPISPKGRPIKSLVGFWVGLWHAKITHITDNNHTTHYVTWVSRAELVGIHKTALKEGWPLPLVSLTAEISGEGLAWRGVLGDAVMHAGSMTSYILIAALYSWAVWVVILMICPELSCWPLIITGTLTAISSLHYLGCAVYYFPEYVLVEGRMTKLRFGWAWWLMGCISVILAVVGVVLTIYDHMYPGKLGAMFILDFYTKSDALSGAPELLYAYDSVAEKHAHIYPLSVNNFLYDNKKMSNKNLLGKNCENRTLDSDTGNGNTLSDAYNANNNEIAGKETQDLIQYVNETENENGIQIGNENDAKTSCEVNGKNEAMMSPITVINSSDYVTREAEHMATLRKRTPPEKSHSDNASKPQNDEYNYTTILEGNTITRKFSAPIMVPQASPGSNGRTFRKSFSKVHSKFKPNFSPRKPSKVNLISASKLDKSELNN